MPAALRADGDASSSSSSTATGPGTSCSPLCHRLMVLPLCSPRRNSCRKPSMLRPSFLRAARTSMPLRCDMRNNIGHAVLDCNGARRWQSVVRPTRDGSPAPHPAHTLGPPYNRCVRNDGAGFSMTALSPRVHRRKLKFLLPIRRVAPEMLGGGTPGSTRNGFHHIKIPKSKRASSRPLRMVPSTGLRSVVAVPQGSLDSDGISAWRARVYSWVMGRIAASGRRL